MRPAPWAWDRARAAPRSRWTRTRAEGPLARPEPPPPEERRFGEDETRNVLRLAAAQDTPHARLPKGGFTLSELIAIAEEAGLDAGAVRRAAALSPAPSGGLARVFLGGPARPSAHARFPGRLPRSRHPELTGLCEGVFGRKGTAEERADLYRWSEEHGPGRTTVEVRYRDGVSEVGVEADRRGWALLTVLGASAAAILGLQPVGGIVGIAASLGLWAGVLAPLLVAAALVRLVFPRLTRGLALDTETVLLGALALIEEDASPPPTPLAPPPGDEDDAGRARD